MSSDNRRRVAATMPVPRDFCETHLHYVLSCSDKLIEVALAGVPKYDLERLRRILERI